MENLEELTMNALTIEGDAPLYRPRMPRSLSNFFAVATVPSSFAFIEVFKERPCILDLIQSNGNDRNQLAAPLIPPASGIAVLADKPICDDILVHNSQSST